MADVGGLLPASQVREGDFVVLNNKICKVIKATEVQQGRRSKYEIVGHTIFNFESKRHTVTVPSSHTFNVPQVNRRDYTVASFDEKTLEVELIERQRGAQAKYLRLIKPTADVLLKVNHAL